jgi:soluble lytic murein transglycosylase-like protein
MVHSLIRGWRHMKFSLKTTILLSTLLAAGLNAVQYLSSSQQHKDALAVPATAALAAPSTPGPTVSKAAAVTAPAAPATAPAPAPVGSTDATTAAGKLAAAGLDPTWAGLYLSVSQQTGTPWQLLAAVHRVETGQSGTTTRSSYAGATGPMQFMPATFNHYALDGNHDGVKDIHNIDDAMLTAGRYLAAGGADKGQYSTALYNYNHSWSYVSKVTGIARQLGL